MSVFTISDLHLSLSADKPMDIFSGWQDYVNRIEKNWNRVVSDGDTVVIPGDISWSMSLEDSLADFKFIDRLKGKKIILKGNHDLWWSTMSKLNAFKEKYELNSISFLNNSAFECEKYAICGTRGWLIEESGTDSKLINREAMRLEASIAEGLKFGKECIVFLHYPPITADQRCEEIIAVLKKYDIKRVYYGHLHGSSTLSAVQGEYDGIEYKLVSSDRLDFTPLLIK